MPAFADDMKPADQTWDAFSVYGEDGLIAAMASKAEAEAEVATVRANGFPAILVRSVTTITYEIVG